MELNLEKVNHEINNVKTKSKFITETVVENKVIAHKVDLPIQVYAPIDTIKQKLKIRSIISKKK